MHTTLIAVVKVALTATTGKNLRLNHHGLAIELLSSSKRLVSSRRGQELGRLDAVLVQETHRTMLVDRQETLLDSSFRSSTQHAVGH